MSDEKETIEDIVNDMRGNAEHNHALVEVSKYLTEIADRIEESHMRFYDKYKEHTNELNRQILVLKHEADEYNASRNHEVSELSEENARLRAALKPVLDAYISQDDPSVDVYDSRIDAAVCVRAVREAKRIYKEGCDE